MSGTSEGARKRLQKVKQELGADYYKAIGHTGGKKGKGRKVSPQTKHKISQTRKGILEVHVKDIVSPA